MANEVPSTTQCPQCHGMGNRGGQTCDLCHGSGSIPVKQYPPGTNPHETND